MSCEAGHTGVVPASSSSSAVRRMSMLDKPKGNYEEWSHLVTFPKRANGTQFMLQEQWFRRLLLADIDLSTAPPADVSNAQGDVKYLSLAQLLHLRSKHRVVTQADYYESHRNFLAMLEERLLVVLGEYLVESLVSDYCNSPAGREGGKATVDRDRGKDEDANGGAKEDEDELKRRQAFWAAWRHEAFGVALPEDSKRPIVASKPAESMVDDDSIKQEGVLGNYELSGEDHAMPKIPILKINNVEAIVAIGTKQPEVPAPPLPTATAFRSVFLGKSLIKGSQLYERSSGYRALGLRAVLLSGAHAALRLHDGVKDNSVWYCFELPPEHDAMMGRRIRNVVETVEDGSATARGGGATHRRRSTLMMETPRMIEMDAGCGSATARARQLFQDRVNKGRLTVRQAHAQIEEQNAVVFGSNANDQIQQNTTVNLSGTIQQHQQHSGPLGRPRRATLQLTELQIDEDMPTITPRNRQQEHQTVGVVGLIDSSAVGDDFPATPSQKETPTPVNKTGSFGTSATSGLGGETPPPNFQVGTPDTPEDTSSGSLLGPMKTEKPPLNMKPLPLITKLNLATIHDEKSSADQEPLDSARGGGRDTDRETGRETHRDRGDETHREAPVQDSQEEKYEIPHGYFFYHATLCAGVWDVSKAEKQERPTSKTQAQLEDQNVKTSSSTIAHDTHTSSTTIQSLSSTLLPDTPVCVVREQTVVQGSRLLRWDIVQASQTLMTKIRDAKEQRRQSFLPKRSARTRKISDKRDGSVSSSSEKSPTSSQGSSGGGSPDKDKAVPADHVVEEEILDIWEDALSHNPQALRYGKKLKAAFEQELMVKLTARRRQEDAYSFDKDRVARITEARTSTLMLNNGSSSTCVGVAPPAAEQVGQGVAVGGPGLASLRKEMVVRAQQRSAEVKQEDERQVVFQECNDEKDSIEEKEKRSSRVSELSTASLEDIVLSGPLGKLMSSNKCKEYALSPDGARNSPMTAATPPSAEKKGLLTEFRKRISTARLSARNKRTSVRSPSPHLPSGPAMQGLYQRVRLSLRKAETPGQRRESVALNSARLSQVCEQGAVGVAVVDSDSSRPLGEREGSAIYADESDAKNGAEDENCPGRSINGADPSGTYQVDVTRTLSSGSYSAQHQGDATDYESCDESVAPPLVRKKIASPGQDNSCASACSTPSTASASNSVSTDSVLPPSNHGSSSDVKNVLGVEQQQSNVAATGGVEGQQVSSEDVEQVSSPLSLKNTSALLANRLPSLPSNSTSPLSTGVAQEQEIAAASGARRNVFQYPRLMPPPAGAAFKGTRVRSSSRSNFARVRMKLRATSRTPSTRRQELLTAMVEQNKNFVNTKASYNNANGNANGSPQLSSGTGSNHSSSPPSYQIGNLKSSPTTGTGGGNGAHQVSRRVTPVGIIQEQPFATKNNVFRFDPRGRAGQIPDMQQGDELQLLAPPAAAARGRTPTLAGRLQTVRKTERKKSSGMLSNYTKVVGPVSARNKIAMRYLKSIQGEEAPAGP
ncbi:unnamed protein product [Amoebophrya sp. A25]|nr:unnamed protein product [Amoebophrya sp. A25]|eukprot:GSA25T00002585001.1